MPSDATDLNRVIANLGRSGTDVMNTLGKPRGATDGNESLG
jgi:hypothetical protein